MAVTARLMLFERHLAREIYGATALVMAAFLGLFAFFDMVHELGDVGKSGYQLHHAIGYVLLTLPGRMYELFPVVVLIGSLYALTLLARHSEITVLRASGLSTARFLVALARIGGVFVIMTFLIGEFLAPPAERAAQQLRLRAMSSVVAQEFRSGLWVKDEQAFVNVREVQPDASLQGVRIYEFDESYHLRSISEAEVGKYLPPDRWQLANVVRTVFESDRTRIERLAEMEWKSALTPDILTVLLVDPGRMSALNLYRYIRHLADNHQKTDRYEIAMWKKLVYPAAALVMMALALPFAYLQDRMGAVSIKVFAGIMMGILFNMLNGLFSSLGILNSWTPFVSAVTPSVLFVLTASAMLWWSERR